MNDQSSMFDPPTLPGYDQCHFFAGIGGWSYALRLAGWPDDRPVWTGSCPCQPLSSAGLAKRPCRRTTLLARFLRTHRRVQDLQRSLENRLRARMAGNGSPEYALTWKMHGICRRGRRSVRCGRRGAAHPAKTFLGGPVPRRATTTRRGQTTTQKRTHPAWQR
jgi:hypothetical protein